MFFKKTVQMSILGIALILAFGVSEPKNVQAMITKEDIQNQFCTKAAASTLIHHDKKETAVLWAEALSKRNGALRFALLSDELKEKEYEKYKETYFDIGGSSPWVVGYSVNEKNKIDDNTYVYEINYTLTDSTQTMYNSSENITLQKFGNYWSVVNHDNYFYMPEIKEGKTISNTNDTLNKYNYLLANYRIGAVTLWAECLKQRDGSFRFAMLSNELKGKDYETYKYMNWSLGYSSPWVVDYSIAEKNKIDDSTYEYRIEYNLTDSSQTMYKCSENITVQKHGSSWIVVKHDNYDYMPDIN